MKMGKLFDLANNAKQLDEKLFFVYCVEKEKEFILDLNRISQLLEQGENIEGSVIGYYSANTEQIANGQSFSFKGRTTKKIKGTHYTLLDTSYFYHSFRIRFSGDGFKIIADDDKDGKHLQDLFPNILGLSHESKTELAEKIKPFFIELARKSMSK
jgi:hypothetical protein